LMELIDKEPTEGTKVALAVQIHRLKKKLIKVGALSSVIKSIHKQGYQLASTIQLV
jgi:DNA-binding response OmpR family regulator